MRAILYVVSTLAALYWNGTVAFAEKFGSFLDPLKVELLDDGRKLKLLNEYRFRDPDNELWSVPNGWVVDGASIPRVFWSLVGGPLEGQYRKASVIHDYYCDTKRKSWESTHLNFYYGMRAAGVGEIKAEAMYYAVYKYGPRWKMIQHKACVIMDGKTMCSVHPLLKVAAPPASEADRQDVSAFERELEMRGAISLEEIRARAEMGVVDRFPTELR